MPRGPQFVALLGACTAACLQRQRGGGVLVGWLRRVPPVFNDCTAAVAQRLFSCLQSEGLRAS